MKTPIDHYIEDALDEVAEKKMDNVVAAGYEASRDIGDDPPMGSELTQDISFKRRSFEANPDEHPETDGNVQIGVDGIEMELVQGIDLDSFKRVASAVISKNAGIPVEDVTWEEMLRGGLQTALETQVIVFAVSGVSRACTHQLVRTRKAAYHQQSQRADYYGPHPETRFPESAWKNPRARAAALRAIYFSHKAYETCVEEDIGYQDARYFLLEGTTNWIMCEWPLRTFLETYAYRACSMFQAEIVTVFRKAGQILGSEYPWLKDHIKISCEKTHGALDHKKFLAEVKHFAESEGTEVEVGSALEHSCTYQGYENVEQQCQFPWARESNRTFKPEEKHRTGQKK